MSQYSSSRPIAYIMSFCGERLHELVGRAEQRLRAARPGRYGSASREIRRGVDRLAGCLVELAPLARDGEVFEREAVGIDHAVAPLQVWSAAMLLEPRADGLRPLALGRREIRLDAGGGGVGGVPMSFSSTHAPRSTGDVRSPYEVRSSAAPLPSSP